MYLAYRTTVIHSSHIVRINAYGSILAHIKLHCLSTEHHGVKPARLVKTGRCALSEYPEQATLAGFVIPVNLSGVLLHDAMQLFFLQSGS